MTNNLAHKRGIQCAGVAVSPIERKHANYALVRGIARVIGGFKAIVEFNRCQLLMLNRDGKPHTIISFTLSREKVRELIKELQEADSQMTDEAPRLVVLRDSVTGKVVFQNPGLALLAKHVGMKGKRSLDFTNLPSDDNETL